MPGIYKNMDECNPDKECKVQRVFDNIISDMLNNKKHNQIVTERFIQERKLNISTFYHTVLFCIIKRCYNNKLYTFFIIKIPYIRYKIKNKS